MKLAAVVQVTDVGPCEAIHGDDMENFHMEEAMRLSMHHGIHAIGSTDSINIDNGTTGIYESLVCRMTGGLYSSAFRVLCTDSAITMCDC